MDEARAACRSVLAATGRMVRPFTTAPLWREAVRFSRRWINDDVGGLAAGVAFYAVLAVFPTLLAVAAALGSLESIVGVTVATEARRTVLEWMDLILTDRAAEAQDAVRRLFEESDGGLFTVATAAALWSGSRGTNGLMRALSRIYGVRDARSYWRRRLVALGLLVATVMAGALVLSMFVVGPLLGGGQAVASTIGLGDLFATLWELARLPAAFLALAAWAALVFHAAPDHHRGWRPDLPGALVTAALWVLVSGGLRLYLEIASGGNEILGALGGALIVLVWLYLLALALLTGGEVNVVLLERRSSRGQHPTDGPRHGNTQHESAQGEDQDEAEGELQEVAQEPAGDGEEDHHDDQEDRHGTTLPPARPTAASSQRRDAREEAAVPSEVRT